MKDRVPLYPGRVTLTPVSGQANTYDMVRADQPTEEGTPLNKENLLSDETAAALGLSGDPTVDDAFGALAGSIKLSEVEATLPSSASWRSVTYGNGKLVAVAYTNKAAYSTNGINWTAATMPSSASWQSVTYGDGKFVAVASSSNKAAYSLDGINWTAATLPNTINWQSVTYGDGKFVAVASTNKAAYSTNGINWSDSAQLLVDSAGDDITDDVAQALGVSKIVTGSYVGTGTSGSRGSCTLTFDFAPKMVLVYSPLSLESQAGATSSPLILISPNNGITQGSTNTQSTHWGFNRATWSVNSVSWYADNAEHQKNMSPNYTYVYFAIG